MDIIEEVEAACPYCGEILVIAVDTTEGETAFVEDCTVCCRPIRFLARCEPGRVFSVDADRG